MARRGRTRNNLKQVADQVTRRRQEGLSPNHPSPVSTSAPGLEALRPPK